MRSDCVIQLTYHKRRINSSLLFFVVRDIIMTNATENGLLLTISVMIASIFRVNALLEFIGNICNSVAGMATDSFPNFFDEDCLEKNLTLLDLLW